MSENIIFCYSGSGHCLSMAKSIARTLGDTDIVMMRRFPAVTDASAAKRVGFVFPCYGGGLPGDFETFVKVLKLSPDSYKFAVEQYAGYTGCGLSKLDELVGLDYWDAISNHSTCIWLMPHTLTFPPTSKELAQKRIDQKAQTVGLLARAMQRRDGKPPKNSVFAMESKAFSGLHAKNAARFTVSDACIGCGTCARICPRGNIELKDGRPVFGTNCIGCLSCLQYCPKEAINMGRITEKRERFPNPGVSAEELNQAVIHID